MNILTVIDKPHSAIDRLSQPVKDINKHFNIRIQSLHPKRPSIEEVQNVQADWQWADIVHVNYWKSGEKLKELVNDWSDKKKLLTHHNPYDIKEKRWSDDYQKVVATNQEVHTMIPYARLIPQGINLNFYQFNNEYTKDNVVNMVAARIEGKKGIREVAQVCKELEYKFILVGRISDQKYFDEIMTVNPNTDFRENISDEDLLKTYYESAIHVCNSVDNFETGTMPMLEAMATGVPVLTRNVGHVPDLYNGENMLIRYGASNDIDDLRKELKGFMESTEQRAKIREKAWNTVKNRPVEKMARQYSTTYYQLLRKDERDPLVSIITPTFDRPEVLVESLIRSANQSHKHIEIVVIDSGNINVEPIVEKFREQVKVPIKYIRFKNKGEYTLAKARNLGVMEAEGEFVCFCDERIGMEENAVAEFINNYSYKVWLYGVKDGYPKDFVENFSYVDRHMLLIFGGFNERIDCYGGMSEEIRTRFMNHGWLFQRIDTAKAKSLGKSGNRFRRKDEIIRAKQILFKLYGKTID